MTSQLSVYIIIIREEEKEKKERQRQKMCVHARLKVMQIGRVSHMMHLNRLEIASKELFGLHDIKDTRRKNLRHPG